MASPLLANLFLHYAFDEWMRRNYPKIPFERYADDVICHCGSRQAADALLADLDRRMSECGLRLHPEKTKIVHCKNANRQGSQEEIQFDFLGYTFRPRDAKSRQGVRFLSFLPAVSRKAAKRIRQEIRRWRLHCWHTVGLEEVARQINPTLRGWVNYYGRFYRSALPAVFDTLDQYLVRWVRRKYKRMKEKVSRAREWLVGFRRRNPGLFAHWSLSTNGGQ